jgi:hypothetical protein
MGQGAYLLGPLLRQIGVLQLAIAEWLTAGAA